MHAQSQGYADLQTQSVFSDGTAKPADFVTALHWLRNVTPSNILAQVYADERQYYAKNTYPLRQFEQFAERAAWTGNNFSILALTDHNTLLGIEPLLRTMPDDIPVGLIGGTELTTYAQIENYGDLGLHLLAYFRLKGASPNLRELAPEQQRAFFTALRDDYLPHINPVLEGVNERFTGYAAERIRSGGGRALGISSCDIAAVAEARVAEFSAVLADCVIQPAQHPIAVAHTDVVALLLQRGAAATMHDAHGLVGRHGPYYVDYSTSWQKRNIFSLAQQLRGVSSRSPVDVRLSLAHPFTYVRRFERQRHGDWNAAYRRVQSLIAELATGGLIDAIEALYPRYHKRFSPPSAQAAKYNNKLAARYNQQERMHAEESAQYFRRVSEDLGLRITGGSDFHGEPDTRLIGIGNGELSVPAHLVDLLFR